jgi:hypothetical protein
VCYWGLPSISADDPAFPKLGYWRGYVWGPMVQLTYWGLQNYQHVPAGDWLLFGRLQFALVSRCTLRRAQRGAVRLLSSTCRVGVVCVCVCVCESVCVCVCVLVCAPKATSAHFISDFCLRWYAVVSSAYRPLSRQQKRSRSRPVRTIVFLTCSVLSVSSTS